MIGLGVGQRQNERCRRPPRSRGAGARLPCLLGLDRQPVGSVGVRLAVAPSPAISIAALSLAAAGVLAALPTFWASVTMQATGTRAALTIALVNSIGNLAGFAGPYLVGWIKTATDAYVWAMVALLAALGERRVADIDGPAFAPDGRG